MNKQIIITAIILTLFALIGGGLVSLTEQETRDQIIANDKAALLFSLNTILPSNQYDNDLTASNITLAANEQLGTKDTSTVYVGLKNNKAKAFIFNAIAADGYNGSIHLLIGIYTDGSIAGVRVVKHKETPGLGDGIEEKRSDWILGFNQHSVNSLSSKQWNVKRDGGEFDQFTGATITPRAIVKSVHRCLLYFNKHQASLFKSASLLPLSVKE